MVLIEPLIALVLSFALLAAMLYKRVSIGIALVSSAIALSLFSMGPIGVFVVLYDTTSNPLTISLVWVTIGVMFLSLLYKETEALDTLSMSFGGILRNPKLVVSCLPAIVGLLPVPGGALTSAPLVETAAEKLGLSQDKKTYVNVWFRHLIYPVYPMSQILIIAAALTGVSMTSIIISQIPVVITMIVVGYFIVLRKSHVLVPDASQTNFRENIKSFLLSFSPILAMILTVIIFQIDVSIAAFLGITMLIFITKPSKQTLIKTASSISIYKIALAAYGAMLLRTATTVSGVSGVLGQVVATSNINEVLLVATLPAALAFILGSPIGGIAASVPIIGGTLNFTPSNASLVYISAFLGHLASPTHICFALTTDYFRSPINKVYRFLVPSLVISFAVAIIVYHLL